MKQRETWVTTLDNPFDPFEESENWKRFDEDKGYYTDNLVARMVKADDELDEDSFNMAVEEAVDRIVNLNLLGIYRKAIRGENNVSSEENRKKAEEFMRKQFEKQ
jgi:hypothetical protein